jgi:hypothetical protein
MRSGLATFMVAVGGTSLICYLLMNRVQNRKTQRESAGGDASSIGPAAVPAAMAGTCFPGSAAAVLRRIAPPRPAIPAGTAAEAAAISGAAAIDAETVSKSAPV